MGLFQIQMMSYCVASRRSRKERKCRDNFFHCCIEREVYRVYKVNKVVRIFFVTNCIALLIFCCVALRSSFLFQISCDAVYLSFSKDHSLAISVFMAALLVCWINKNVRIKYFYFSRTYKLPHEKNAMS